MKKVITFTLALIALTLLSISVLLTTKRYSAVSEVYHHYKGHDDLCVGFVKDYRIDDSTTVDVTTLTAKDSASWENLMREMNVNELTIVKQRKAVEEGNAIVSEYYCAKNHPEKRVSLKECMDFDLVIYSYFEKTIYVFNAKTQEQGRRIQAHKNNEILK
ncbi:MAG: hypothetical protein J6T88_04100 [Bacteroidales bacterium]|nr:hypothetical protein [Bacteroidales bacterium]